MRQTNANIYYNKCEKRTGKHEEIIGLKRARLTEKARAATFIRKIKKKSVGKDGSKRSYPVSPRKLAYYLVFHRAVAARPRVALPALPPCVLPN
jgi:hypothetical protein